MDPLDQIKLRSLMDISRGIPEIIIGVIDGPVDFNHPAFKGSRIKTIKDSQLAACNNANRMACMHGTFVVGILSAQRGVPAPSICTGCEIMVRPIFNEYSSLSSNYLNAGTPFPKSTAEELSDAIAETIDAGAKIINLSVGISASSLIIYHNLQEVYDYALQKGVIIVAAAGNEGNIGYAPLLNHPWIIPVAASDENCRFYPISNFGPSIGTRGLMAPGVNIRSTSPGGGYSRMSGTSFAVPFVTGAIAILWSLFPTTTAGEIIYSIMAGALRIRRSVIPPLLNCEVSFNLLKNLKQ